MWNHQDRARRHLAWIGLAGLVLGLDPCRIATTGSRPNGMVACEPICAPLGSIT
jgi:hypothetical protein